MKPLEFEVQKAVYSAKRRTGEMSSEVVTVELMVRIALAGERASFVGIIELDEGREGISNFASRFR